MRAVQEGIRKDEVKDQEEIDMREQNLNPVKVLTSGYEGVRLDVKASRWSGRAPEPFFAGGKMRNLERLKWWEDYAAEDGRPAVLGDIILLVGCCT